MLENTLSDSRGVDESPVKGFCYSEGLRTPPIPVSAVTTYLYCPRLAYLKYGLRLRMNVFTRSQVRGVIVHKVLESLFMRERAMASLFRVDKGVSRLYRYYVKTGLKLACSLVKRYRTKVALELGLSSMDIVDMVKPVVFKRAYMYISELLRFHLKTGLEGRALAEAFIPRRESEVMLRSLRLGLSGLVDLIEAHHPVEIKTGILKRESHVIQVTLYALLLEDVYGIKVREGYIYYADRPTVVKIAITDELRDRALELKEKASRVVADRYPPEHVSCRRNCLFRRYCINLKKLWR